MANGLKIIRAGLKIGVVCLCLHSNNGGAALSYYLYLPGIPGTSQVAGYANWANVLNFQFGASHLPGNNDPAFTGLLLNKSADATSPLLAQICASGGYLPSATLQVVKDGTQQVYQVQLYNVGVTSLVVTNLGSTNIVESEVLRFGKIAWTYTQYDVSGQNPTNITTDYDLLYGKLPVVLSASGVENPGNGTMDVTWNARAGTTYNLLGSPQVDGVYTLITTVMATNLGPMTVTLPPAGCMFFYRLQDNP